jgi:hypothetical protein
VGARRIVIGADPKLSEAILSPIASPMVVGALRCTAIVRDFVCEFALAFTTNIDYLPRPRFN